MKYIFIILSLSLLTQLPASCSQTKYQSFNQYNSKGQKVGTVRVYYQGDRTNVSKIEKRNTNNKRTESYRRK